jgi:two-component system, NtrC family, sensor histidine kinase HydH
MMWKNNLSLRVAGPTILLSLLLWALCAAAAVYLSIQQSGSAEAFREDVSSTQAAHDLANTLNNLIALLREGSKQVEPLHDRVVDQLHKAEDLANKDEEKRLVGQLQDAWQRYLEAREKTDEPAGKDPLIHARHILERDALPSAVRLQEFNARETRESAETDRRMGFWLMVGLIVIGTVGSLAGLFLGYGVARSLRQSIYHLSVRVQDAADKLGQDVPAVALTDDGDLRHLHRQMQAVIQDIEQVVSKLQQREREVLRAEQLAAVGQLAAGLAHELRNPLTSIKLLVQTNREETGEVGVPPEDLDVIELEIRRMERCLQTFLDFARPPRPERRLIDLADPVHRTLALVGARAGKQGVGVRFLSPQAPLLVEADGEQLQQLLVNLTLNALDMMPQGGMLEVESREVEGRAELRVRDTGPGVAPELLPRLFEPFVSSKETGLGLGLVISRRIAETHGGTLTAANRPEGGACFTLQLPMTAEASLVSN